MSFNKTKLALAVAAGLAVSPAAFATNGIIQAGNGMVAHGMGGAGLSNAGEAAAGMDNPALISGTGDSLSVAWSMFMPDRTATYGPFVEKSDAKMFAIPQVAFTSKISNSMSWGIMAYAMGGMNTDYRFDFISAGFFGYALPSTTDLSGMIVAPTMSFKLSDKLSLGGSLLIAYENFRARNLFGSTGAYNAGATPIDYGTNEGSTMGYGVKLGGDFKISDGISVGAVIQPKVSMGEISWFKSFLTNYVPGFPGVTPFTGDAALTLPNEFGVGGKFAVGKNVDVVADIMYYQWTSVDVFKYFGWDDQIVYKVGAEWRATDKLALRAGINYGKSPIQPGMAPSGMPTVFANYAFPAITENHVTLGLGYKMDKNMAINAYYLYAPETTIDDSAVSGMKLSMSQNAFGLGINYQSK